MKKIVLFGPLLSSFKNAYGGGTGGYTRNMSVYLNHFKSDEFTIVPCFHTVRGQYDFGPFTAPVRFAKDISAFLATLVKTRPDGVHILAQYRGAIPREFAVVLISRMVGKPVLYEIKAGAFMQWYSSTNPLLRRLTDFCLKSSRVVLAEGNVYLDFIKETFGKEAHYFPNFIPTEEIPAEVSDKLRDEELKVLFVGYCFKDKGIYEVVSGCEEAAKQGTRISLTIIGKEHDDFTKWMDAKAEQPNLKIQRLGLQPHKEVLRHFKSNDIFCYPTSHKGEGHNNSINEALMMGLVIITTNRGFLGDILSDESAYFLKEVSTEEVGGAIRAIDGQREAATRRSSNGRKLFQEKFTSDVAFKKLSRCYEELVRRSPSTGR
ncbi:glycosyltransferase family 4 protein [Sorangium sp. So ce260]|uniref:glycosyltransferase family 4 protein n=1 Tax=Sorangium sp. So ce260 TaxID=3133291 RepID=UPI003F5E2D6E